MRAWQLRSGALIYRALVRLRGAQDNHLGVLGQAPPYEQSREFDQLLTTALRRPPIVETQGRHRAAKL